MRHCPENRSGAGFRKAPATVPPDHDVVACERLGWKLIYLGWREQHGRHWHGAYLRGEPVPERLPEFHRRWEAVLGEFSLRWGDRVAGWWVDGCKFRRERCGHDTPPNFASLVAAIKAGKPDAIVALNPSMPFVPAWSATPLEDYLAGHDPMGALNLCAGPTDAHGVQWHALVMMAENWGRGEARFCDEMVVGYTRQINLNGGVVTWDVPIHESGLLPDASVRQLFIPSQACPRSRAIS